VRKSFNLPPGFWRGACARKSGRILVVQGMEHWLDPSLKKSSRLVLMDYRANVLWKHPMGWESWACDLSEDGAWAVYATCPDEAAGRESILTALRGIDGRPLWSRAVAELDPVRPLECREVRISPGNRYLAVGTGLGTLVVLALADGIPAWSAFCGGQVRRLRFFDQDRLLLAGAGDGNLHAFETATGRLLWKTFVWGWAFTDGIDVTADRRYIAVGTKNGYACVLDAATGRRIWAADLGQPVHHVTFSPKGDLLAAGGGRICVFRTSTGEMAWQGGFSTSCAWFDEGRFLVAADRTAAVYTAGGTLLALPARTAGSVNFLYASEDGARIVMATDRGEIVAIEGATQRYRSGDEEPEHP
jgi:outer membrane protein assembly factor BamB